MLILTGGRGSIISAIGVLARLPAPEGGSTWQ